MSAIEAASAGVRDMADGSLRITLEFEPRHAKEAYALFGARGTPVAVAALKSGYAIPQEQPAEVKGGERAKWLAMRGQEPAFQDWLRGAHPELWSECIGDQDVVASVVRALCGVLSRAEIDNHPSARARFEMEILAPWREHNGGRA